MAKVKNKIYLVETSPGNIRAFNNWPQCQAFVHGKSYPFAGGPDRETALGKLLASKKKMSGTYRPKPKPKTRPTNLPTEGLTSDAGTHGNPGPCEYQVTDISGRVLEHRRLGVHTNNYAELAGILGMVRKAIETGDTLLWTDSTIAMGWIRSGSVGQGVHEPELIREMVVKIQKLLRQNPQMKLVKWDTRSWGQIPSDFGRK